MQITKEIAHVVADENLFVHEVRRIGEHRFQAEFRIDGTHPYLYENPAIANHVSGTTFLDTSRQLLKAICHLFYAVPVSDRFLIQSVGMEFVRWAKVGVAISVTLDLDPEAREIGGHAALVVTGRATWRQEGWELGTLTGKFTALPEAAESILMRRQYRQPPRLEAEDEMSSQARGNSRTSGTIPPSGPSSAAWHQAT